MPSQEFIFKQQHSLAERKDKAQKVLSKYGDRVPVICEKDPKSQLPQMDKTKILVPRDLTVAQFVKVIRKRIQLKAEETIFLFINDKMVPTGAVMSEIYQNNKDIDGFLYVSYSAENYFG